jgi:hypothetical protein
MVEQLRLHDCLNAIMARARSIRHRFPGGTLYYALRRCGRTMRMSGADPKSRQLCADLEPRRVKSLQARLLLQHRQFSAVRDEPLRTGFIATGIVRTHLAAHDTVTFDALENYEVAELRGLGVVQ